MSHETSRVARGGTLEQIEHVLNTAMHGLKGQEEAQERAERLKQPGHPLVLPRTSMWLAVLVCVLRGFPSIRAVWRVLVQWLQPAQDVSHQHHTILAPCTSEVVALDDMHLDQVKRHVPIVRHFHRGNVE